MKFLDLNFRAYIETLLNMKWQTKSKEIIDELTLFIVDLLVAQSKFTSLVVSKLVSQLIPKAEEEKDRWSVGTPTMEKEQELQHVRTLISRLLEVIPMSINIFLREISEQFPFYKQPSYIIGGYLHNLLLMIKICPKFSEDIFKLVLLKLLEIDVNTSRLEIEDAEYDDLEIDENDDVNYKIDDVKVAYETDEMKHSIAETLDIGMVKVFKHIQDEIESKNKQRVDRLCSSIYKIFESELLPTHKSHHVQFVIFYLCSFRESICDFFIKKLWHIICNFNFAPSLRQAAVGYLASLLARGKFVSMCSLKNALIDLTNWTHQYIQRTDGIGNSSLRAHLVFYSISQAVFYIIAFRSKTLTTDNNGLLFLQSLQLSMLVTCQLNPLRVCFPAIATTFAGVTRAHQLAYCHTVLERNARRKLATIYSNDSQMPDECLDTFFPFDPYLLKKSAKFIEPHYLHYRVNEEDDEGMLATSKMIHSETDKRKRKISVNEDADEFLTSDQKKRITTNDIAYN